MLRNYEDSWEWSTTNRSSLKTFPRRLCLRWSFFTFKTMPLRDLLSSKNEWHWGQAQEESLSHLKKEMTQVPVLAHYCSEKETIISADTSSYGLGAVPLQVQEDDTKKPVAYASRSMTSTEQRYAQVEKEALATTWACEKFADFVLGKEFPIETDHKPLVLLLRSKCLQDMPPRI